MEAQKQPAHHPHLRQLLDRTYSATQRIEIVRDWIYLTSNEDTKPRFLRLMDLLKENE